jgi:zinc transporter ZupT
LDRALIAVLVLTFINGLISYLGGAAILFSKKSRTVGNFFLPFTAGILLATVFFDILPEVLPYIYSQAFVWVFLGIAGSFFAEVLSEKISAARGKERSSRVVMSVVLSGVAHNLLYGAVIAAFARSWTTGLAAAIALAISDIPHEMGVFSLLHESGLRKKRVMLIQLAVTIPTMIGGVVGYLYRNDLYSVLPTILALLAGWFVFIVIHDLFGTMQQRVMAGSGSWWRQLLAFALGAGLIWWILYRFGYLLLGAHPVFIDHPL